MNTYPIEKFENTVLREKYFKYIHSSGLEIYVFPKKLTSTYAIFASRYGSLDNSFKLGESGEVVNVPDGIAHFLEHKLFANEDGSDAFDHFSAQGADANAYTSFNKTAYLFSCTENFEKSLEILIDFVSHPYFTEESVAKERGIIAQEIKMYDDSPAEACYYGMLNGLYEKHSIKRNICGSVDSIEKITPELLYECYKVFYSLSNMALIVCGDVLPESVINIADKMLPKTASQTNIVRISENGTESAYAYMPTVEKRMNVSKPIFNIGIKDTDIPSSVHEKQRKDAAMGILNEMLFCRAGKLYNELFCSGMISPDLSYCYTTTRSFAFNSIAGEADDPKAVLKKIKEHITETAKKGLSREDFERCKKVVYAVFVKEFDSTESIANNMLSFIFEDSDILEYSSTILDITYEEVCTLFYKVFDEKFFTLSAVYPISSEQ